MIVDAQAWPHQRFGPIGSLRRLLVFPDPHDYTTCRMEALSTRVSRSTFAAS
jgi:hypothetical protein